MPSARRFRFGRTPPGAVIEPATSGSPQALMWWDDDRLVGSGLGASGTQGSRAVVKRCREISGMRRTVTGSPNCRRLGPVNGAVRTPHDVKPSSRQAGTAGTNPPFHCEGPAGGHEVASRSGSSPPAHSEAVIRRAAVGTMVRRPTHGRPATRSGRTPPTNRMTRSRTPSWASCCARAFPVDRLVRRSARASSPVHGARKPKTGPGEPSTRAVCPGLPGISGCASTSGVRWSGTSAARIGEVPNRTSSCPVTLIHLSPTVPPAIDRDCCAPKPEG